MHCCVKLEYHFVDCLQHMTHWRSAECHVTSHWPHPPPHRQAGGGRGGGEGEVGNFFFNPFLMWTLTTPTTTPTVKNTRLHTIPTVTVVVRSMSKVVPRITHNIAGKTHLHVLPSRTHTVLSGLGDHEPLVHTLIISPPGR